MVFNGTSDESTTFGLDSQPYMVMVEVGGPVRVHIPFVIQLEIWGPGGIEQAVSSWRVPILCLSFLARSIYHNSPSRHIKCLSRPVALFILGSPQVVVGRSIPMIISAE